jgi:hypothetical protein
MRGSSMYLFRTVAGSSYIPVRVCTYDPYSLVDAEYIVENETDFSTEEIDHAHETIALADFGGLQEAG